MKKTIIHIFLALLFCSQLVFSQDTGLSNDKAMTDKIKSLVEKVEIENRFVESFDFTTDLSLSLPIGIKKTIAGKDFIVVLEQIFYDDKEGDYLTAVLTAKTPDKEDICFRGENIKFTPAGFTGDAKLLLVSNHSLDFDSTKIIIKGDEQKTWVEFDCKGYKRMHLQGEVIFDKNKLQPDDKDLQASNQPVRGYFEADVVDFNNLLLEVSIEPFQVKGLKDFGFSVQNAVFDYSSVAMK